MLLNERSHSDLFIDMYMTYFIECTRKNFLSKVSRIDASFINFLCARRHALSTCSVVDEPVTVRERMDAFCSFVCQQSTFLILKNWTFFHNTFISEVEKVKSLLLLTYQTKNGKILKFF